MEKFRSGFCFGLVNMCVIFDISRARMMPRIVTMRAVTFVYSGMVMGGVFVGRM